MSKDEPLTLAEAAVPEALRSVDRWVGWQMVTDPKRPKPIKRPKVAGTKRNADATNARDWRGFDVALAGLEAKVHDGIGVTMGEDDELGRLVLIDFDDGCFDPSGALHPVALEWVRKFRSYTEYSPSRRLHILLTVTSGKPPRLRRVGTDKDGGKRESWRSRVTIEGLSIEVYDRARYSTVTGDPFTDPESGVVYDSLADSANAQEVLDEFCDLLWPAKAPPSQGSGVAACSTSAPASRTGDGRTTATTRLTDQAVIGKLCGEASKGAQWRDLLNGEWESHGYESASEADLALCAKLAFYSAGDPEQVERIFSAHPCGEREKWKERADYRSATIQKAVGNLQELYSGSKLDPDSGSEETTPKPPAFHGISFVPKRLTGGDNGREVEYAVLHEGTPTGSLVRVSPRSKEAVKDAARDVVEDLKERDIRVTITQTSSELRRRILTAKRVEQDIKALEELRGAWLSNETNMCDEGYRAWCEFHRPVFRAPTPTRKSAGIQVWCEAGGGGWRYADALVKVIDASTATAVASADDYRLPDKPNPLHPYHKALEVARLTFQGRLLRDLPEEDGAAGLGADSHAAAETRRVIEDLFLSRMQVSAETEKGRRLVVTDCAAAEALEAATTFRTMQEHRRAGQPAIGTSGWRGAWKPINFTNGNLFVSLTDAGSSTERIWLGLTHRAFDRATHAAGKSLSACRTILNRYGLVHEGDEVSNRVRTRAGNRIEIVVLSRELTDHLIRRAERHGQMGDESTRESGVEPIGKAVSP